MNTVEITTVTLDVPDRYGVCDDSEQIATYRAVTVGEAIGILRDAELAFTDYQEATHPVLDARAYLTGFTSDELAAIDALTLMG